MSTFNYRDYVKIIERDKTALADKVKVIRTTVKAQAPGILLQEIASIPRPPVDRGAYRRSWKVMNIPGGARLYSISPYAMIIERGRRPGSKMPPLQLIIAWLARKGIVKGTGSKKFATEAQYQKLRSAAFVIARAIARRGLPARWVMRNASVRIDAVVRQALADAGFHGWTG